MTHKWSHGFSYKRNREIICVSIKTSTGPNWRGKEGGRTRFLVQQSLTITIKSIKVFYLKITENGLEPRRCADARRIPGLLHSGRRHFEVDGRVRQQLLTSCERRASCPPRRSLTLRLGGYVILYLGLFSYSSDFSLLRYTKRTWHPFWEINKT